MKLADTYETLNEIGQGSYAVVHKAINKRTGEICAIKKINVTSELKYQHIKNEISIMCESKCENIVRLIGSDCLDGVVWIIMEYCPGGSVKDAMRHLGRVINEEEMKVILRGVLNGLDYLHANGKIHRDVKAANILLNEDGLAKLGDFGVSEPLDSSARNRSIIGTPLWLPPEVLNKENYSSVLDIWSLGITIIEMGEGQPPYNEMDQAKALGKIADLSEPAPTFHDSSKWSPELVEFLVLCLEKRATERKTAHKLLQHELVKLSPPNDALKGLVAEVCSITSKSTEPETRLKQRSEFLLKESVILFSTYNNRIMKVIKVDQLTESLNSIRCDFRGLEAQMERKDIKINEMRSHLKSMGSEITKLERERHESSATLKNNEIRKSDLLIQLEKIRDQQKRSEGETKRNKLGSLGEIVAKTVNLDHV